LASRITRSPLRTRSLVLVVTPVGPRAMFSSSPSTSSRYYEGVRCNCNSEFSGAFASIPDGNGGRGAWIATP
jgi:hypothetical protein